MVYPASRAACKITMLSLAAHSRSGAQSRQIGAVQGMNMVAVLLCRAIKGAHWMLRSILLHNISLLGQLVYRKWRKVTESSPIRLLQHAVHHE